MSHNIQLRDIPLPDVISLRIFKKILSEEQGFTILLWQWRARGGRGMPLPALNIGPKLQ